MTVEQLQLELSIETNELIENIIINYARLLVVKYNINKIDWLSINNKIENKYSWEVLEFIKHKAWKIIDET
jgi:hypothetical protein